MLVHRFLLRLERHISGKLRTSLHKPQVSCSLQTFVKFIISSLYFSNICIIHYILTAVFKRLVSIVGVKNVFCYSFYRFSYFFLTFFIMPCLRALLFFFEIFFQLFTIVKRRSKRWRT